MVPRPAVRGRASTSASGSERAWPGLPGQMSWRPCRNAPGCAGVPARTPTKEPPIGSTPVSPIGTPWCRWPAYASASSVPSRMPGRRRDWTSTRCAAPPAGTAMPRGPCGPGLLAAGRPSGSSAGRHRPEPDGDLPETLDGPALPLPPPGFRCVLVTTVALVLEAFTLAGCERMAPSSAGAKFR